MQGETEMMYPRDLRKKVPNVNKANVKLKNPGAGHEGQLRELQSTGVSFTLSAGWQLVFTGRKNVLNCTFSGCSNQPVNLPRTWSSESNCITLHKNYSFQALECHLKVSLHVVSLDIQVSIKILKTL